MTQLVSFTELEGVYGSGYACGIKANGALDIGFIYVPNCVGSAVVQSQNQIRSATLDHNAQVFAKGPVKLMIVNSGNANSVTGDQGVQDVQTTVTEAAKVFNCDSTAIAVASTGIIGVPMPMEHLVKGIQAMDPTAQQADLCAKAILTTDLTDKSYSRSAQIQGQTITVSGITKGSGMIAPNMATTLGFIVTNLALNCEQCTQVLKPAINDSYNMLTVDTDCSTNDMVSLQSSGEVTLTLTPQDIATFTTLLTDLAIDMAKAIAKDGEGANHLIEVTVTGAKTKQDAQKVTKQVLDSPLVKTAIAGEDPNWGRIVMAIGKEPSVTINPNTVSIAINNFNVLEHGLPLDFNRTTLKTAMQVPEINICVDLGVGDATATGWGCDLTHGYIDINTAYN
jgi:glutamate N-acetyltransferase / amino-acid N-acetyltransferase